MFTDEDAETESLLGDLYTEFGLPREADVALSRVQAQDIPSSTRNMPWLRYGNFYFNWVMMLLPKIIYVNPLQNLTT
jgi:hypothetical protein